MALPEKDWYTLDEIAQRWSCAVDDLWHYAETQRLRLSARFDVPLTIKWKNAKPADLGLDELGDFYITSGPLGLFADEIRRIKLNSNKGHFLGVVLLPVLNAGTENVYGDIAWDDPECPGALKIIGLDEYGAPRPVELEGPLIVREERDRFEKLHRIRAHAGALPTDTEMEALDIREKNTLLRMLAVLIKEADLSDKKHKAAEMLASLGAQHGISLPTAKTMAEKIDDARKAADGYSGGT